jgi:hypothetical protein
MFSRKKIQKIIIIVIGGFLCFACHAKAAYADGLTITKSLPVLPVLAGVTQKIEISLPRDIPASESFDVEIEAKSGWGVLLFPSGPSGSGMVKITSDTPVMLEYRWSGVTPTDAPVIEKIAAAIPKTGLSGELEFQVGVDVRITEISFPNEMRLGMFNPVEIFARDVFNPSLDVAELLRVIGASAEVSLAMMDDSAGVGLVAREDQVVSAFFSEKGSEVSYPGERLQSGTFVASEGGKFVWRGRDGRAAGIVPPSGGQYHIEAALKSNLGGVPLKYWVSPGFDVSGGLVVSDGMPELIASTLSIISRFDAGVFSDAEEKARELMAKGESQGAIALLGGYLRRVFSVSLLPYLGRYSSALSSSGKGEDEISSFLGAIMKGFGDCGVLIFTRGGLAEWDAKDGTAYENARYISVPFSSRENIAVRIIGSGAEDVSMWKIIAQGTNAKKYPKGKWIKEIAVHTSEVRPPQLMKP